MALHFTYACHLRVDNFNGNSCNSVGSFVLVPCIDDNNSSQGTSETKSVISPLDGVAP